MDLSSFARYEVSVIKPLAKMTLLTRQQWRRWRKTTTHDRQLFMVTKTHRHLWQMSEKSLMNPLHFETFGAKYHQIIRVNNSKFDTSTLFMCFGLHITLPYKKHNVIGVCRTPVWYTRFVFRNPQFLQYESQWIAIIIIMSMGCCDVMSHTWRWVFAETNNIWLTLLF